MKTHDLSGAIEEVIKLRQEAPHSSQQQSDLDVKEVREQLGMTQEQFSESFGVSMGTLQQWEQGRRKPNGPALLLLKLIQAKPELVADVIASRNAGK